MSSRPIKMARLTQRNNPSLVRIGQHSIILWLAQLAVQLLAGSVYAEPIDAAGRTRSHVIHSLSLSEKREVFVQLPEDYDPGRRAYPVVYVLDGEWNFNLVASYLDYLSHWGTYPHFIVTGIRNTNRNRDYVPRADPSFPYTGGAEAFLRFVEGEWVALVDSTYSAGRRILVGHSFGGVFALHTLFTRPGLFDSHIVLGASAWVSDRVLFGEAEAFFRIQKEPDLFLYMSVGQGDGGPTVPSGNDLADLLERNAPHTLEWYYDVTVAEDHFTNVVAGLHEAFRKLYPMWHFDEDLKARARSGGREAVDAWFDEKESLLGDRFQPQWYQLGVAALQLLGEELGEATTAIISRLVSYYPQSVELRFFSGHAYEALERYDEAEREYLLARELAEATGADPNRVQIQRFTRSIDRVREKREAKPPSQDAEKAR